MFVIDYGVRVLLAHQRWHYVRHHLLDLLVVVLPILRPLRLLRLVALLRIVNRGAAGSLRGRVAVYVSGGAGSAHWPGHRELPKARRSN